MGLAQIYFASLIASPCKWVEKLCFTLNSSLSATCSNVKHVSIITLLSADLTRLNSNITETNDFTHSAVLDEYGRFTLFWKFDAENITFEVRANTSGWVGLGFSPNGGMPGSDIVTGWVRDGEAYLQVGRQYFQ